MADQCQERCKAEPLVLILKLSTEDYHLLLLLFFIHYPYLIIIYSSKDTRHFIWRRYPTKICAASVKSRSMGRSSRDIVALGARLVQRQAAKNASKVSIANHARMGKVANLAKLDISMRAAFKPLGAEQARYDNKVELTKSHPIQTYGIFKNQYLEKLYMY